MTTHLRRSICEGMTGTLIGITPYLRDNAMCKRYYGTLTNADAHPPRVSRQVVDPVGRGLSQLFDLEVVHTYAFRIPARTPLSAAVLEVANKFLLLPVNGDHWLAALLKGQHGAVDVQELAVPLWGTSALRVLAVGLQAVVQSVEDVPDRLVADLVAHGA